MAKLQCSEQVWRGTLWDGFRSPCKGGHVSIRSDGKPWCGRHDPERIKANQARDEAQQKAYMTELKAAAEANEKRLARAALCVAACEGVADDKLLPGMLAYFWLHLDSCEDPHCFEMSRHWEIKQK